MEKFSVIIYFWGEGAVDQRIYIQWDLVSHKIYSSKYPNLQAVYKLYVVFAVMNYRKSVRLINCVLQGFAML